MRKYLAVLLCMITTIAMAGEVSLDWVAPTENTDNTPITNLDGFKIYQSNTQGGPYTEVADITNPNTTSYTVVNLPDGTYFFVSTAYNTEGEESDYSNEASRIIVTVPKPPTNLTVSNLQAYLIQEHNDRFILIPVGTIPVGTPCDTSQTVNGLYAVDRSLVEYAGTVRPPVVVAQCS